MNRRICGARARPGWWCPVLCSGRELLRQRGAASAPQPGWRGAPRDHAVGLVARRFLVGLGCHWATKC
jgi:hypothetical protein